MADAAILKLVDRLEAVAKRLEAVETQLAAGGGAAGAAAGGAPAAAAAAGGDGDAPYVAAYKALVAEHIGKFLACTANFNNPEVSEAAAAVKAAVDAQTVFLSIAAKSKKPTDQALLQKLIAPTSTAMGKVGALFEKHRGHKMGNHLQTMSEGINALGWVVVEPTPGPHVGDMRGGSEFYSNRILKEYKDKDENQVNWVKGFNGFLQELQKYVKQYHTTGTAWNPRGEDAAKFADEAAAAPAAAAAAPAAAPAGGPPPPPGPAPPPPAPAVVSAAPGPDMSNVFSALNKGGDVTAGLKKVTRDMTNKDKVISGAVTVVEKKPAAKPKGASAAVTRPPKFALAGTKWEVEWQDGNKGVVIDKTELKHTVYIYKCKDSVVQIKGKVNSIIVDSCEKTAVVFDNAVASVDIVNCKSIEMQVTGNVPNFSIDKCSSVLVHLSKEAKTTEFVTSKCDSVNVSYPIDGQDDPKEQPVPEQFKTVIINDLLHTEMIRHE